MRALTVTHNNQTARTTKMTEALDPARTGSFTKLVSACGDDQTCPSRDPLLLAVFGEMRGSSLLTCVFVRAGDENRTRIASLEVGPSRFTADIDGAWWLVRVWARG